MSSSESKHSIMVNIEKTLVNLHVKIYGLHQDVVKKLGDIVRSYSGDKNKPESEFENVVSTMIDLISYISSFEHDREILRRRGREKYGTVYTVTSMMYLVGERKKTIEKLNAWLSAPLADVAQEWLKMSATSLSERTISGKMLKHLGELKKRYKELKDDNKQTRACLKR